jgi:hypothetical protein
MARQRRCDRCGSDSGGRRSDSGQHVVVEAQVAPRGGA